MAKRLNGTRILAASVAIFAAVVLAGCGGGGGASSSTDSAQSPAKILSWSPPTAYQDNSPLDPSQDLSGYSIYIKEESAPFTDADDEAAFASPANTSLNLIPVCSTLDLPPGRYQVSVRAIAKNGLKSDFSPAASFTL